MMDELQLRGIKAILDEQINTKIEALELRIMALEQELQRLTEEDAEEEGEEEENQEEETKEKIGAKDKSKPKKEEETENMDEATDLEDVDEEPEEEEDEESEEIDRKIIATHKKALDKARAMKGNQITNKQEIDELTKGYIRKGNLKKRKPKNEDPGFDEAEIAEEDDLSEYEEKD